MLQQLHILKVTCPIPHCRGNEHWSLSYLLSGSCITAACTKKTIICIWFPEGEESRERRRVWEVGGQVPLVMVSVRSQYCMLPLLISTVQQGQLLWKLLHRGRSSTTCGGGSATVQHTGHENFIMGV